MVPKEIKALFLGPKSENYLVFKEMLGYMMDDYAEWRRSFHPDDPLVITPQEQKEDAFQNTLAEMRRVLVELAGLLQVTSVPWFSPRYLGHMNADTLMAANLGYMLALLYNQNNVAYEGSPGTTGLELEVGKQLAGLMGYDPAKAWGNIAAGSARGLSFWLHVDAAYGGYVRSAFLDPAGHFMELPEIREGLHGSLSGWPSASVYRAYQAIAGTNSITIDPHKLGYVPYPAGAFLAWDRRVVDLISYFAPYVFDEARSNPQLLGSYILEGSKPGAAAAAVWTAHRLVPLHWGGYGRLIGSSIGGARQFYRSLIEDPVFRAGGREYLALPLTEPDLNIVVYAFNERGNASLEAMNSLNQRIFEQCFRLAGPLMTSDFILSKTSLEYGEYLDTPLPFLRSFGIPEEEWRRIGSVFVLRSCMVTPFLAKGTTFETYWRNFRESMEMTVLKKCQAQ